MERRVLMSATVPSMIGQFNINNIKLLQEMGYIVDVAGDFTDTSVWPIERVEKLKQQLHEMGVECIQIDFSRSPFSIKRHIKAYKDSMSLLEKRNYAFVHTHTPIASAIIRLVAHKTNTKVIYTAHGFHFYKGAPLKNWAIFYPLEKYLSKYTHTLITINKEDFARAEKRFKAKNIVYVPGIGVDVTKFQSAGESSESIRQELGISNETMLFVSVGELSHRKNHSVIIKALSQVNKDFYYIIVGQGELEQELKNMISSLGLNDRVSLLGYRTDISQILHAADVFLFPSLQEGLPVALMEAMACGLPCIVSEIRGNTDLVDSTVGELIHNNTVDEWNESINTLNMESLSEKRKAVLARIEQFDKSVVEKLMRNIYSNI